MSGITTLLWDIGGVLLTNGWDQQARAQAAARFGLAIDQLEQRHAASVEDLEIGRLSLDDYLRHTVFHEPRSFGADTFKAFMREISQPYPEMLALASELARSGRFSMATVNNESHELNQYRIERFELRRCFTVFFSSCFLGTMKPDPAIWTKALWMLQRRPQECVFIDDRTPNVAAAQRLGMHGVEAHGVEGSSAATALLAEIERLAG